jgi:hypothetical protein
MTDDPGDFSQNATIRRTQALRAPSEVRIQDRCKYFERYSEMGRVPTVRTQAAFGLRSRWGNQYHADPVREPEVCEIGSGIWEMDLGRAGINSSPSQVLCQRAVFGSISIRLTANLISPI